MIKYSDKDVIIDSKTGFFALAGDAAGRPVVEGFKTLESVSTNRASIKVASTNGLQSLNFAVNAVSTPLKLVGRMFQDPVALITSPIASTTISAVAMK